MAYCSLEDENSRVLEVPLWMLDVAACSKTAVSKLAFVSADSLRELKEILESARLQGPLPTTPETQHQYLQDAKGAEGAYRRSGGDRTNVRYLLVPSAIRAGQTCRPTFNRRRCRCWRSYSGSIEG